MPIRNKYKSLLIILFLMLGVIFYFLCPEKPTRKMESAALPPSPSPSPPPIPNEDSFDLEACLFGFFQMESQPQWISDLYENLKTNISWNLNKKKPDLTSMVKIPGGEIVYGCDWDESIPIDCLSKQKVKIESFYIDRSELTNAEYNRCVETRMCLPTLPQPHIEDSNLPDRPALLTYKQAERFCLWAGKRLPTEVEWEAAARGQDARKYPWGNEKPTPKRGNICGKECTFSWADATWADGYEYAAPVGRFPAGNSPYGLIDMAGNVKEWVKAGTPQDENHFIARGASWYSPVGEMYVFYRQQWVPQTRVDDKGVRCVADPK